MPLICLSPTHQPIIKWKTLKPQYLWHPGVFLFYFILLRHCLWSFQSTLSPLFFCCCSKSKVLVLHVSHSGMKCRLFFSGVLPGAGEDAEKGTTDLYLGTKAEFLASARSSHFSRSFSWEVDMHANILYDTKSRRLASKINNRGYFCTACWIAN